MFVKSKFPLNLVTKKGLTATHLAAYYGRIECLKLLLKAKADSNKTSKEGLSPLYFALKNNNMVAVKLLVDYKSAIYYVEKHRRDISPFFFAIRKQNVEAIEYFCDRGVDMAVKNSEGLVPLTYAAIKGYDDIVNYLSLRTEDLD